MSYPKTITVHLYQCSSLCEGMNVRTILKAGLSEYNHFTADSSEELERNFEQYTDRLGTCCIVGCKDGIICGGIAGVFACKIWVDQYFQSSKSY